MIHSLINNYTKAVLCTVAILTLIMIIIQIKTGHCLKTKFSPDGIVSLELAWDQRTADAIYNEWQKTCKAVQPLCKVTMIESTPIIEEAIRNIRWDFGFILTYVTLLYVMVVLHESKFNRINYKPYTMMVGILCVAAGLLDIVENILMLQFLSAGDFKNGRITILASLKFAILVLVVVYILWRGAYLRRLTAFTLMLVHLLWRNRVSVIGLLVLYFALWKSDQGQDLLINLNASHWGPLTFYIILSILATFYWYWPKYFAEQRWSSTASTPRVSLRSLIFGDWNSKYESLNAPYMPRLLGLLTFVVPACGILQALDIFEIPYILNFLDPFLLLVITIVFFLVTMEYHLLEKFFNYAPRLYDSLIFFLFAVIIGLGFFNRYSANQLGLLSIGLYAIAFMFMMITSVRNNPRFYEGSILSRVQRIKANTLVLTFVIVASLAFFGFNCYPYITANGSYRFMTLPIVLTAIVFYSFIFFLLMIWGKKKSINFSGFVIAFSILVAVVFDNKYHDVKTVDRVVPHTLPKLSTYMHNWILSKKDEILQRSGSYPVFIVNAYGGGIRAAAWTTLSVSFLDSITGNRFQDHVLAYSGASGGTIGSSVLCAVRRNNHMDSLRTHHVKSFYQNDFLTAVLIGLFGRDVWFSTLGISWFNDRARLQDRIWEHHTQPHTGDYFSSEFTSLWYPNGKPDYKIPLLFSNTYHVEKGLKGILAPVTLGLDTAQFESAVIVNNLLNDKGLLFSTGSFLSARFPYISPAAKITDDHHFLDGGLKENSGAETAEEIYKVYEQLSYKAKQHRALSSDFPEISADTVDLLYKKVKIYFLSLNNSVASSDDPGPSRNLVELTAPFEALYNNWIGNTSKADSILRIRHRETYFELRPTSTCVDNFKPVLPLGWQISDRALTGMIVSLSSARSNNRLKLYEIKKIIEGSSD